MRIRTLVLVCLLATGRGQGVAASGMRAEEAGPSSAPLAPRAASTAARRAGATVSELTVVRPDEAVGVDVVLRTSRPAWFLCRFGWPGPAAFDSPPCVVEAGR
jgi:hypothetical protein